MNDNMKLGRNIANLRQAKKMTQKELANSTRLSKSYIAAIEEGIKRPRITTLTRIAECLDIELEDLLK